MIQQMVRTHSLCSINVIQLLVLATKIMFNCLMPDSNRKLLNLVHHSLLGGRRTFRKVSYSIMKILYNYTIFRYDKPFFDQLIMKNGPECIYRFRMHNDFKVVPSHHLILRSHGLFNEAKICVKFSQVK